MKDTLFSTLSTLTISNFLFNLIATTAVQPITITNPKYDSGFEYCMRITDKELPKNEGSIERISNQLPQQPSGTNEKNEKNELSAVPVELPATLVLFFRILQP